MSADFPDSHRDLLGTRFATLATLGKDGGLDVRGTARVEPDDDYAFAKRVGVVTVEPTNVFAVDVSA